MAVGKNALAELRAGIKSDDKKALGAFDAAFLLTGRAGLSAEDRLIIVVHREMLDVGREAMKIAGTIGAKAELVVLEELGPRPLTSVPPALAQKISELKPTLSLILVEMQAAEEGFRKALDAMLDNPVSATAAELRSPPIREEIAPHAQAPETIRKNSLAIGTANMVKLTGVTAQDRAVILTDRDTLAVGQNIREVVERAGAKVEFVVLEDYGERPLTSLPESLAAKIRELNPNVSFLAITAKPGELGFRKPYMGMVVGELKARHAHMPTITAEVAGGEAMCADYEEVKRVTARVHELVKNARKIKVTAPNGTYLTAEFDPDNLRWQAEDGFLLAQGAMGNLPAGEDFTTPVNVNGRFVTTLLGDYFGTKYGVLDKTPVTIELREGRVISVSCDNKDVEREFSEYVKKGENTDRIGEFAIGTNAGVTKLTSNMLESEKAAGVHMAVGDPLGDETGAKWVPNPLQHCDMILQGCDIVVDGMVVLMQDGKFVV